jgi:hypothetical protein
MQGKQKTCIRQTGQCENMSDSSRITLTCPHFVMRGAVGGERQIGQVVCPSSRPNRSPLAAADANADDRGMITCNISCHWKNMSGSAKWTV